MVQFRPSCFIGLAKRYDVRRQGTNNLALNTRGPACLKLPQAWVRRPHNQHINSPRSSPPNLLNFHFPGLDTLLQIQ